jgi:multiple sugar transport system ATP-binding protein
MATIELDHVTKRYDDGTEAVHALDLDIADGELLILVGPSGCGKSTALRMIAGLEEVTEGELRIGGEAVTDRAPKDRDIAMVFQNYALYPHMTVRENMGFALRLAGVPRAEVDRRVVEAAALLDLQAHLDRRPRQLSGGQRQRVAMGRAIVRSPAAFLMDEPLSNLDAKLRVQMRGEIARLQERLGTTTVYVTHDQTEALTLGDHVAVMRDGVLQQLDTPEELYRHPANQFVAGFIGSPPMAFLDGAVRDGTLTLPVGDVPVKLPDGPVVAGLRPEHLRTDGPLRFATVVTAVELLGHEALVHVEIAGSALIARLPGATRPHAGDRLELGIDPTDLTLFSAADGVALNAQRH